VVDDGMKGNERYARTHHGLWIPMRDLVPVPVFDFHGEEVPGGNLDFAWVIEDRAPILSSPSPAAPAAKGNKAHGRFERVDVLEVKLDKKGGGYVRIGDGEWLRARDVRRPSTSPPPPSVRANERWIDVDLATQTLVAYEGIRPVFATLVSTGKGKE